MLGGRVGYPEAENSRAHDAGTGNSVTAAETGSGELKITKTGINARISAWVMVPAISSARSPEDAYSLARLVVSCKYDITLFFTVIPELRVATVRPRGALLRSYGTYQACVKGRSSVWVGWLGR